MKIWVDAQLSPVIALWINESFTNISAVSMRSLDMLYASDIEIFKAARAQSVVILSKDADFVKLIELHGIPPQLIWVTCGNTSNSRMFQILKTALPQAKQLLESGEQIVEIGS